MDLDVKLSGQKYRQSEKIQKSRNGESQLAELPLQDPSFDYNAPHGYFLSSLIL